MSDKLEVQGEQALSAERLMQQVNLIQEVMRSVMIGPTKDKPEGVHYGIIPGCGDKPTLLKPGAEKLSLTFRLAPKYEIQTNDLGNEHREYEITCSLFHITTGQFFGSGVGVCSTLETKYKYRTQMTDKPVPKEYWRSRNRDLLGGSQYSPRKVENEWFIFEKIEHDNPADYYNTIKKMAKKRAHVDAVLTATGASDIFAQDLEDMGNATDKKDKKPPIKHPEEKRVEKSSPSGNPTVTVKVVKTEVKKGKTKGKEWSLYIISCSDNNKYSTFDSSIAQEAKASGEFGKSVEIEYIQAEKRRNIESLKTVENVATNTIPKECQNEGVICKKYNNGCPIQHIEGSRQQCEVGVFGEAT